MCLRNVVTLVVLCGTFLPVFASAESDKGIGPIKELKLDPVDDAMVKKGVAVFDSKCMACHKIGERYVGPALKDVTKRRSPEWILNMILNPAEMLEKNETAKELLGEYLTPMTFQNVTQEEARQILEYFRAVDEGKYTAPVPTPAPEATAPAAVKGKAKKKSEKKK